MKISCIIVTYNGSVWLNKCLKSIMDSSIPLEIIVIDNNSTDDTLSILNSFSSIITLKQDTNLGFGKANNIGISYALNHDADFVFLLNQDCYLESKTIETLAHFYKTNKDYGILSPIHLNGKGDCLDSNFHNYIQKNKNLIFDAINHNYSKNIYNVPFVNAAGWLISKEVLNIIGGFDPVFYHYGEDVNYCQRIIFHGFKVGIAPGVNLFHDREGRGQVPITTINEKLKNAELKLTVDWANINKNPKSIILKYKRRLKKNIIKLLLQMNFVNARYYWKEFKLVHQVEAKVERSRSINIEQGSHYFDLNKLNI